MSGWLKVLQALVLVVLLAGLAVTVFAAASPAGVQPGPRVTSAVQGSAPGQRGGGEQGGAVNWNGDFFGGGEENAVNWNTDPGWHWYAR